MSSRGGVSAVDMYALAKHSPLVLRRIFIQLGKTSCSNARAVFAAGSHHMPRWLWGLLRQARLPQFGQHSEFTSVLAARAQGQENALLGRFPFTRPNEQIRAATLLDIVRGAKCGIIRQLGDGDWSMQTKFPQW